MKTEYISSGRNDTFSFAAGLADTFRNGDVIALYGQMGSGKTVFVSGVASVLAPEAPVSSPTYAILNVYRGKDAILNHFDMYRITSEDDLESTGFYDVIEQGVTFIEWPEKIPYALPEHFLKVSFQKLGDEERKITIESV